VLKCEKHYAYSRSSVSTETPYDSLLMTDFAVKNPMRRSVLSVERLHLMCGVSTERTLLAWLFHNFFDDQQ